MGQSITTPNSSISLISSLKCLMTARRKKRRSGKSFHLEAIREVSEEEASSQLLLTKEGKKKLLSGKKEKQRFNSGSSTTESDRKPTNGTLTMSKKKKKTTNESKFINSSFNQVDFTPSAEYCQPPNIFHCCESTASLDISKVSNLSIDQKSDDISLLSPPSKFTNADKHALSDIDSFQSDEAYLQISTRFQQSTFDTFSSLPPYNEENNLNQANFVQTFDQNVGNLNNCRLSTSLSKMESFSTTECMPSIWEPLPVNEERGTLAPSIEMVGLCSYPEKRSLTFKKPLSRMSREGADEDAFQSRDSCISRNSNHSVIEIDKNSPRFHLRSRHSLSGNLNANKIFQFLRSKEEFGEENLPQDEEKLTRRLRSIGLSEDEIGRIIQAVKEDPEISPLNSISTDSYKSSNIDQISEFSHSADVNAHIEPVKSLETSYTEKGREVFLINSFRNSEGNTDSLALSFSGFGAPLSPNISLTGLSDLSSFEIGTSQVIESQIERDMKNAGDHLRENTSHDIRGFTPVSKDRSRGFILPVMDDPLTPPSSDGLSFNHDSNLLCFDTVHRGDLQLSDFDNDQTLSRVSSLSLSRGNSRLTTYPTSQSKCMKQSSHS